MRVASTQYHATMQSALQNSEHRLEHVMQQMAAGLRVLRPSDDPVTNVRLSRLTREEAALQQYLANIGALRSRLQQNESLLDGMTQDMLDARDLLVWASDGGNTSRDVEAMAGSLAAIRDSLFYSSNIKDQEGRYLFSGTVTSTQTIQYAASAPAGSRYGAAGNTDLQRVVVGNGVTEAANVTLAEMSDVLNRLDLAVATLQVPGVNINDPAVRADVVAALGGIDAGIDAIGTKIAALGGAQNRIATLEANHDNLSLSNRQAMLALGELDYGEAAVRLNGYTVAVQATQKAYAKVSALSLFDVL